MPKTHISVPCERLEAVKDFTVAFKHPISHNPLDFVNPDWINKRIEFIESELVELKVAAKKNDIVECLDALLDIDYFLLGTVHGLGLSKEYGHGFRIVHDANMAKLCTSDEEAQETMDMYKGQGIDVYFEEVMPGYWAVYNKETKKVMKSINYVAPDLKQLF